MPWFSWRKKKKRTSNSCRPVVRRPAIDRHLECLESRLVLSALSWTGATDANWSTSTNWNPNAVPGNGDSLTFPAGAAHVANTDDLAGLTVNSITFSGASGGYSLGGTNSLTLTAGINASNTAGTNTIALPLVLSGNQSFAVAGGAQLTISGDISGSGALSNSGAGTLDLAGTNTYGGGTTVASGTVLVDGSIGSTILSGGTLGGVGTVGTITTTGGTISPGDTLGTLNSGGVAMNSATAMHVDINGGSSDLLNVSGTVNLGGANLTVAMSSTPALGTALTIVQSTGAITGTFAQGASIIINGQKFAITYNANSVVLTAVKANTTSNVTSSANPAAFGQPVTFTATVVGEAGANGTPTGSVNFFDGVTQIGTGAISTVNGQQQATFTTSSLSIGPHSISVAYSGDGNFNGGTSPLLTQTIGQALSQVSLSAPVNAIFFGQPITFTATVAPTVLGAGTPSGTVNFFDGGTQIGSATLATVNGQQQASFTTSSLAIGNRSITAVYAGDANFNSAKSSAFPELVGNTVERFVNQVYRDLLKRDADPQSLLLWANLLYHGMAHEEFVQAIVTSNEFHVQEVQTLYQRYLGRAAEPAAANAMGLFLLHGGTIEEETALIVGSQEYLQNHGGTVNGFADGIYHDLLGRSVDPAALAAIANELSAGATRTMVVEQVLTTNEYRQNVVQTFFSEYLGRPADATALSAGTASLNAGVSDQQLAAAIVASDEYFNRLGP